MPTLYVAFQTHTEEPTRFASGSMTTLKTRMREIPGARWTLGKYVFKPSVENLIQLVEDVTVLPCEEATWWKTTAAGQVRQIDEE